MVFRVRSLIVQSAIVCMFYSMGNLVCHQVVKFGFRNVIRKYEYVESRCLLIYVAGTYSACAVLTPTLPNLNFVLMLKGGKNENQPASD